MFFKIGVLKNYIIFTKNTCAEVSLQKSCKSEGVHHYKKETPTQVFSCEYCKDFKNTFFYRTYPVAASGKRIKIKLFSYIPFVTFQCLHCKLLKTIFQHGLQYFTLKPSSWGFLPTDSFWKFLLCLLPTSKLSQETKSSAGVKIWVATSQIFPGFKYLVFGRNLVKMSV